MSSYDIVIIGSGPAGMSAGMYASRAALKCLLLEKGMPGGQASTTDMIENYPGFKEGISGPELMMNMHEQASKFGLETRFGEVKSLKKISNEFIVDFSGEQIRAKTIIYAAGTEAVPLGVPGEQEFRGRGVSYCATCDGAFFRDLQVAVIGGGDSALEEAMFLTRFASKVFIVHRRNEFRATKLIQERIKNFPKLELIMDSVVTSVKGKEKVQALGIRNVKNGQKTTISVDGVFVYVGSIPNSQLVRELVKTDEKGFIFTAPDMQTNLPGLFAAGDVRVSPLRQVVTAVSDGAIAAVSVEKYIEEFEA